MLSSAPSKYRVKLTLMYLTCSAPPPTLCACRQRLVWSDPAVVNDLLKKGLFARIYEPQVSWPPVQLSVEVGPCAARLHMPPLTNAQQQLAMGPNITTHPSLRS